MNRLNQRLVVAALEAYKDRMGKEDQPFKAKAVQDQIELLIKPVIPTNLLHNEGGDWIGAARNWMQSKARNGSDVIWGSHQQLHTGPITVSMIEDLAARVAAAAINEFRGGNHADF